MYKIVYLTIIFAVGWLWITDTFASSRAMDKCVVLHNGIEIRKISKSYHCRTLDKIWIKME